MKSKLFVSSLLVIIVGLLVGGGTFAYFTDSAANGSNIFTAGTVKVRADRDLGDPVPGPMFYVERNAASGFSSSSRNPGHPTGLWSPGMEVTRQLDVTNIGTLDFSIRGFSATLSGISDPGVAQSWAEAMEVQIYVSNDPDTLLFDGNLAQLLAGEELIAPNLRPFASPGSLVHLSFKVKMDEGAGNNLQGVNPVVNFSLFVEQVH